MTFRYSILAASMFSCLAAFALSNSSFAANAEHPVVVELYTSQGCSSCPPADAFLGELAKRDDVIALTFPVDYWDYLGWKDTLASPENSIRQRNYAIRRGDRQVYTPQMVLDGRTHAVGSRKSDVERVMASLKEQKRELWVPVEVMASGDTLMIKAEGHAGQAEQSATLWLAYYTKKEDIAIRRGENAGKAISYYNVVRQMTPIGKWSGKPIEIELPKTDIVNQGYDGCAVFLQVNGSGPIIGAAAIDDWMGN